jgi:hypothetical protein
MPVDQFTNEAHTGLVAGKDQIIVGTIGPAEVFNGIVDKRREAFENLAGVLRSTAHWRDKSIG